MYVLDISRINIKIYKVEKKVWSSLYRLDGSSA